jgi:hypothetical protein
MTKVGALVALQKKTYKEYFQKKIFHFEKKIMAVPSVASFSHPGG